MVVSYDDRQLHLALSGVGSLFSRRLLCNPHGRLGNAVEIDVVLSDELVNAAFLTAPVVLPLVTAPALLFKVGLCERYRCPQRLRPYPHGQTVNTVHHRSRHAPLDVACQSERHERFACTVAYAIICQHLAGFIAVAKGLELNGERGLFLLFQILVCGHAVLQREILLLKLTLDVDNRGLQKLLYGLPDHRADVLALFQHLYPVFQQFFVVPQLEIPVGDRAHGGLFACQGAYRVYEVLRHILVTQVALVRIALFGSTALNGTLADDLSAVKETARFLVIELHGAYLFQLTLFVQ